MLGLLVNQALRHEIINEGAKVINVRALTSKKLSWGSKG